MRDQERRTRAARKHKGVTDTVRGTPAARSGTPRQLPEQHDAINNTGHPTRQRKHFSHLGNVYRHSTLGERKALWEKVAVNLKKGEKAYVSTHGSGVHWVHVRLSMCVTRLITDFYFVGFD